VGLLWQCSCAATPTPPSANPVGNLLADLKLNLDAGRGRLLIVPVRLKGGEELPFVVVRGAS
jgi:hypothetical protein